MSVPDPSVLPNGGLPADVSAMVCPEAANPVFFGHYWLTGQPVLQAPNALCLDYSVGRDGPLVSCTMEGGSRLTLEKIKSHGD